jgi:hypothetical protein
MQAVVVVVQGRLTPQARHLAAAVQVPRRILLLQQQERLTPEAVAAEQGQTTIHRSKAELPDLAAPASSSSNTKSLLPLQSSPSSPRRSG